MSRRPWRWQWKLWKISIGDAAVPDANGDGVYDGDDDDGDGGDVEKADEKIGFLVEGGEMLTAPAPELGHPAHDTKMLRIVRMMMMMVMMLLLTMMMMVMKIKILKMIY